MMKFIFTFLLGLATIALPAQMQIAIWTFPSVQDADTDPIDATEDDAPGTPTVQQFNQDIDPDGTDGTAYTDMTTTYYPGGKAIQWDDIKGSGADAELYINLNTTNWKDIFVRFHYMSESATSFDLHYSTNGGSTWVSVLNDAPITADGLVNWYSKTCDLSAVTAIENVPSVIIRLSDMSNVGNDKFNVDNIELYGTKIITPGSPLLGVAATTTPYLHLSPYGGGKASGVINDPTDPCQTQGIVFDLADSDTPAGSLSLTATSSNTAVVPNSNLNIVGTGGTRTLYIQPTGVGYATITVTLTDGTGTSVYTIAYAASATAYDPANTQFHTSMADGSSAIPVDSAYMFVADDETNIIRLFSRNQSGWYHSAFDVGTPMGLSEEADFEGSLRVGSTIYWIGSLGNNKDGELRPDREYLCATNVSGTGVTSSLSYVGKYALRNNVISWGDAHGYNFTASAADGVIPKRIDGLNVEGFVMGPDGTTAFVGFRAPLVPVASRTNALICPIANFHTWFNGGSPAGAPTLGTPIELNLGGRGIRSIDRNAAGEYLIVAGGYDNTGTFALYKWTGYAADAPVLLVADLTSLHPEGIVEVPSPLYGGTVELIDDDGTEDLYADGSENKALPYYQWKKFRSINIPIGPDPLAPVSDFNSTGVASICPGGSVTFTDNSTNTPTGWSWNFGDGGTSTLQNPVYVYNVPGTYDVTLTTTNTHGTDVEVKPAYVTVYNSPVAPVITAGGAVTFCNGGSVNLSSSYSTGNGWSTGSTGSSITVTTSNLYILTYTDINGCTAADSQLVTVNPNPAVPVITPSGPTTLCTGETVTLTSSYASGNNWNTGNTSAAIVADTTGMYVVTYTDMNGCTSTASQNVTVSNCTSMAESVTQGIMVYPNPASDRIFVSGLNQAAYTLVNGVGQVVLRGNLSTNSSISLAHLEKGMYYLLMNGRTWKVCKE